MWSIFRKKMSEEKGNTRKKQISTSKKVNAKVSSNSNVTEIYIKPSLDLLKKEAQHYGITDAHIRATALRLEQILQNFGMKVHVINASCGPSVTRYEMQLEQGVRVKKVVSLSDDIKLNLGVSNLRIEAPSSGKCTVGIEVPNEERTFVMLRDIIESEEFQKSSSKLFFAVGKDFTGKPIVSDIAKMKHLLVAGTTGSGKSVLIDSLIISILYKASPDEVKFIMVDTKGSELITYNGIPHLLIPVVTDLDIIGGVLNWTIAEMRNRFELFAKFNVRDIDSFNKSLIEGERTVINGDFPKKMYQLVVILEGLYDSKKSLLVEIKKSLMILTERAHIAGIHLVFVTQRPSADIIGGEIKLNIPSRIAFSTSSSSDSRIILGVSSAEKLLGKGDMLYYPAGSSKVMRVQGAFVSSQEIQKVIDFINGKKSYIEEVGVHININARDVISVSGTDSIKETYDAYFADAGKFIIEKEKASIGMLQRMFKIGFNRAARIMDQLAEAGVVGGEEGTKPREILMTMEEFEKYLSS